VCLRVCVCAGRAREQRGEFAAHCAQGRADAALWVHWLPADQRVQRTHRARGQDLEQPAGEQGEVCVCVCEQGEVSGGRGWEGNALPFWVVVCGGGKIESDLLVNKG